PVRHLWDGQWVVNDFRIGGVNGVNIGEVFVEVGLQPTGDDGTGNVRATTGESCNLTGFSEAKETREDELFITIGKLSEVIVGFRKDAGVVGFITDHEADFFWIHKAGVNAKFV